MWDLIVSVPDHCLSFYFVHFIASPGSEQSGCFFSLKCKFLILQNFK